MKLLKINQMEKSKIEKNGITLDVTQNKDNYIVFKKQDEILFTVNAKTIWLYNHFLKTHSKDSNTSSRNSLSSSKSSKVKL